MTSHHTTALRRMTSARTGLPCWATLLCAAALLYVSPLRAQLPAPPPPAAPPAPPPATPPAPAAPEAPATAPPEPPPAAPAPPTDQGPDTLPPLETPSGTVQVAKPPTVTVVAVGPTRAPQPVRAERRLALLGELSWNGLAGFGPILVFHAYPQLAIDLGAGLGFVGWKLGVRTRYNFLTSEVTPFVGAGFMVASGFDAPSQDLSGSDDDNRELNIKLRPSAFFQGTIGLDYTDSDGFTFLGALGYAVLMSHDNVEIVTGTPDADEQAALNALFKSGIVISIGIGYSFR